MNCPECRFENPEDVNFCYECIYNFPLTSKTAFQAIFIDEKLSRINRYLPRCIIEKVLNQKDKLEGERKQVIIIFCDIKKFTSLVDKLGPEEAYQIINQVYEILINYVHDLEG